MKLREEFLKANPYCQWCLAEHGIFDFAPFDIQELTSGGFMFCDGKHRLFVAKSTEIHHKKGRGKYLCDTSTWMAVSRQGHDMIHANPLTSYEKGYMLPRN